jgi:sRNA-binding protein
MSSDQVANFAMTYLAMTRAVAQLKKKSAEKKKALKKKPAAKKPAVPRKPRAKKTATVEPLPDLDPNQQAQDPLDAALEEVFDAGSA